MRRIPGLSRIITIIDTMERDHLELVEAHTFLERSYLDLVANYRSLEQAYGQLQYKHHELGVIFQRLTRPTLQSNGHSKSEGIVIPNAPPIPPPLLRYWVAGHDDLDWFLKSGQQAIIAVSYTHLDVYKRQRFLAAEPEACPSLTKGEYVYDFGDTAGITPLVKMYTLGHTFMPPGIHAGGLRYHGDSPLRCV